MTFSDLVLTAVGNLWRMKLRTILTISGVVIAIAAFVSMLSFGAGMQENVQDQFEKLGLLSTVIVYPARDEPEHGATEKAELDAEALSAIAAIPGVNLVYPLDAFSVTVAAADTTISSEAQALPESALETGLFSQLLAGSTGADSGGHTVLIAEALLEDLHIGSPDSAIGIELVISVQVSTVDSGLAAIIQTGTTHIREILADLDLDSLPDSGYRRRLLQDEAGFVVGRFVDGYMRNRRIVSDTLRISGVLETRRGGRSRIRPVIVPVQTALRFQSFGFSGDPTDLFAALQSGSLPDGLGGGQAGTRNYPRLTVDLDPAAPYELVRDSIEALGFRAFSYAEQFKEIRRFFRYFNMALGIVGLIALVTASLGIVNTMVMSILERRREIGVLKSLGAYERDIRFLFLVESSVIGAIGAVAGIGFGWVITRVASLIARGFMEREGVPVQELFALPLWLVGTALAFGVIVSLVAGAYPAARAARVDPVEALRGE